MQYRTLAGALFAVFAIACGRQSEPETAQDTAPALEREAAPAAAMFVQQPPAGAQLLFVGQDESARPAGQDGIFVPLSTFSVERDGIPNEFPSPDSMAARLREAGVHGGRIVIVGEPIPAGRAWAAFDYLGLGNRAALLDGGPAALASAGAAAAPAPNGGGSALEIDVRDDMIVDAAWVHERLTNENVVILDARPPAEFSGATPGEGVRRPGHIPGARNVFWQTLVESAENPRLKEEAELRRIFEAAGATPGKTLVAYCRTGGQGSFLYTVARHLGYDVRLYDGSFIDWSRTSYPVER